LLTAYLISGQAADEKLFENLQFPSFINIKHVHWIEPLKNESLAAYSTRLAEQIDTSVEFVLVGVSLGGIVSVELNKILRPLVTIIISSISTRQELRPLLKLVNSLKLQRIVPGKLYNLYTPFLNWYFGALNKREKELLKYYTRSVTPTYMKWAVNAILTWKNETRPANLFHIHGTRDRIFPHKRTNANVKIEGGTHLMVHNRPEEISRLLGEKLGPFASKFAT
jgi:pimeloyl-ACP methyl ester carboxylesterase